MAASTPENGEMATSPDGSKVATPGNTKYDAHFTDVVIAATGPNAHPRLKQIMPSLYRHLHDFAREVDLTVAEWLQGVELINQAGRMSDDKRNETQLVCDVLGLESLVDDITSKLLSRPGSRATPSAVLGPFYRADAPVLPNGSSIVQDNGDGTLAGVAENLTWLSGRVMSTTTGGNSSSSEITTPLPGATVDVWESAPNGLYEQQDASQPDMNLRGRFAADAAGRYAMVCLRPVPYPIPADGPAGALLALLDRHPYRPAHIHFVVSAPGHRTLVTQVFDRAGPYLADDAVFAVKDALLVDFVPCGEGEAKGHKGVRYTLDYDIVLEKETA